MCIRDRDLLAQFNLLSIWAKYSVPGHWPDADMLPIGYLGPNPGWNGERKSRFTDDEAQTLITLWSISRSPLMIGSNLPRMDSFTESLLTNSEVLAVDQRSEGNHPVLTMATTVVWLAHPQSERGYYLGIFNVGDSPQTFKASWEDLGIANGSYQIRDLWTHSNLGVADSFRATLKPHASCLLYTSTKPVGVSTGKRRSLTNIESIVARQREAYERSVTESGKNGPTVDAIETTLGWDTIFEPEGRRVISPVSRIWSVDRGGYVLFDWDSFFASTMAAIGDRDLAYANAIETLRGATPQGFVPNYSRSGGWKTFDRSEPPVGSITVFSMYQQFHDRWFLEETFRPLLDWNLWWAQHRDIQGYLTWGSDGNTEPVNLDDANRGTRLGAILESGLDNSPIYDDVAYSSQSHLLDFADVGLMSMYIADCDALATIADILNKQTEAKSLRERSSRYRNKLQSLWDERTGMRCV